MGGDKERLYFALGAMRTDLAWRAHPPLLLFVVCPLNRRGRAMRSMQRMSRRLLLAGGYCANVASDTLTAVPTGGRLAATSKGRKTEMQTLTNNGDGLQFFTVLEGGPLTV